MAVDLIEYTITNNSYTKGQDIKSDCNSLTFYNNGTNIVVVDGVQYMPGQQFPIPGNLGEIIRKNFNLQFVNIGGNNNVVVYRKIYINNGSSNNN